MTRNGLCGSVRPHLIHRQILRKGPPRPCGELFQCDAPCASGQIKDDLQRVRIDDDQYETLVGDDSRQQKMQPLGRDAGDELLTVAKWFQNSWFARCTGRTVWNAGEARTRCRLNGGAPGSLKERSDYGR